MRILARVEGRMGGEVPEPVRNDSRRCRHYPRRSIRRPRLRDADNLQTILSSACYIGIVALGMTFVVISGNYADLSVSSQVGIAAVCAIALQGHGLAFALAAAVAGCLAVGLANGVIIGFCGANPIVVTLGTQILTLAVLDQVTQGQQYNGQSQGFANVMGAAIGPVPVAFLVFLALGLVDSSRPESPQLRSKTKGRRGEPARGTT